MTKLWHAPGTVVKLVGIFEKYGELFPLLYRFSPLRGCYITAQMTKYMVILII